MSYIYVGVDPGLSGAIAAITPAGLPMFACKMPETPEEMWDSLGEAIGDGPFRLCLEHVGASVRRDASGKPSTQGVASSWKFARNFGQLEAITHVLALSCPGSESFQASPQKWQRAMGLMFTPEQRAGKSTDEIYREKKKANREAAIVMFPGWKITHWCADAFLLAEYARRLSE